MFEDITKKLKQIEKYQRIAVSTVFAQHYTRIFVDGKAADGSKIGSYVAGPYKELRAKKGKETSFVDLSFTNAMRKDYKPTKSGTVAIGFSNTTEAAKADFNEERYGKIIFALSDKEADLYMKTLDELIFGK